MLSERIVVDAPSPELAYEEIQNQLWWLQPGASEIDGGELYAQLKAPTRVRDISTDDVRYR